MKRPPYKTMHREAAEQLAAELSEHGLPAKRDGRYLGNAPDVECESAHIAAKYTERLRLFPAFEEVEREAGARLPVLATRRKGSDWLAIIRMDDLAELLRQTAA